MRILLHFAIITALAAGSLSAADKTLLRAHWEAGKVYTMENVMNSSTIVPGLGESGKQTTNMTQTMTITVSPEGDKRLAVVKIAGIKALMNMMGQVMNYDSSDPAKSQPMLQQAFGSIVGKEFTLVYDKDDKVTDVRGMDKLTATPVAGAKGPDGKQFVDAFRKSQEMGLPKDPVAPGDSWTFDETIEMAPLGTMHIKGTGKFDSIVDYEGRKHAKLIIEGTFISPEAQAGAAAPMIKFGEGSTMKVENLFDLERRVSSSSVVSSELKMSAAGQEIPVSQKVTTKLIKVEDVN
ncbi:MAG: hypothetical protein K8R87_13065 [Verrucomicrobia bacterium]|nr:hypothetical protein [Verrucomicrobiota bacterium]